MEEVLNVLKVLQFIGLAEFFYVNYLILVFYHPVALVRLYGLRGLVYYCFGSQVTWRIHAQVLGTLQDDDAAVVAQIAITGLGLAELSSTHWLARAMFLFSVLASLMTVYFGFVWMREVDKDTGQDDSRNIMIVYLVSITACFGVYSVTQHLQSDGWDLESVTALGYVEELLRLPQNPAHQSGTYLGRDDRQQSEGNS
ncbi:hypothetical protein NHJ13051_002329 [Beauveria bassiana]